MWAWWALAGYVVVSLAGLAGWLVADLIQDIRAMRNGEPTELRR